MTSSATDKTIRLTVGQAIVKYLQVQHSRQDDETHRLIKGVFGIFGHGNVSGLGQGLIEYGDELPYYRPSNEQGQVHLALGHAKATRRLSTFACTASVGPGSTNMLTAATDATINRLPVLLLPSDYYGTRHQGVVLQQVEHPVSGDVSINDSFRPLCRFFDRILRPEQLLTALPEAMRVLTDPADTGAVVLSLPQDIQCEAYDYPERFFEKRIWRIERRPPDPQRISEAMAQLKKASRPVIIAGGGVIYSNAFDELKAFSDQCGIPVGETTAGRGAIDGDSPMHLGGQGVQGTELASRIMGEADLVFCVGTRLSDFTTASRSLFQHSKVRFVNINVGGRDAFKVGGLPVVADAKLALQALIEAAGQAKYSTDASYQKEVAQTKEKWLVTLAEGVKDFDDEAINDGQLLRVLFEQSQPGDAAVGASSSLIANIFKMWQPTRDRPCFLEYGYSCMGYEIPAAIGTRMARPQGEVYTLVGDGTYLMNPTELVTAVQEGLKITALISVNHGYQCILAHQRSKVGHDFGNEFRYRDPKSNRLDGDIVQIDYAKNAESLGCRAWHVKTEDELRSALAEARRETLPCVICVETEPYRYSPGANLWWDVSVAEVTGDPITRKLREQYEKEADLQRFHY